MKNLVFIILLLVASMAEAQLDSTKRPLAYIKVDLLNAINPVDPSFLASMEIFPFGPGFSTVHEFGFVTALTENQTYGGSKDINVVNSFKMRHGLRYTDLHSEDLKFFIGGYYQYRKITVNETYIIGYECEGDCVYYRKIAGVFRTYRSAFHLDIGMQYFLHPRIMIEGSYGLGVSYFTVDQSTIEGGNFVEQDRFIEQSKFGQQVFFTIGGKICFVLYK